MFNFKTKFYLNILLLFCFTALISAYFIEYILGHQPCNLCLIERIPYLIAIILIILTLVLRKNQKFLVLLLILTFVFSLGISIYHFGIEKEFFQESPICDAKNLKENITKEELLEQLDKIVVSCKDVTFKIFGLSLTAINIVLSILLIITLAKIYSKYEKNK